MVSHRPYRCNQANCGREFRNKIHLARHYQQSHSTNGRSDSLNLKPSMKTRAAFFMQSAQAAKIARILFPEIVNLKTVSKNPFVPINISQIKQEIQTKFPNAELPNLPKSKKAPKRGGKLVDVAHKLGTLPQKTPEWLIPLPKNKLPQPERLAVRLNEKDGNHSSNNNLSKVSLINSDHNLTKKITHEQSELDNHPQQAPLNRRALVPPIMNKKPTAEQIALRTNGNGSVVTTNGKARISIARIDGKNKLISWHAPDDILFVSNDATKKLREQVQASIIKRLRRRPCNKDVELPANYNFSKL